MGIKVHLYFNKNSHNREVDSLPRFYLKPVKLLTIEKVAFTRSARNYGYIKSGNRLYRHKHAGDELTTSKTEKIYKDIQENYPYGYKENDPPTFTKYQVDVKYNDAFQAFYAKYWEKNPELQTEIVVGDVEPYPYIEFTTSELVTVKTPVGDIPALPEGVSPWAKYDGTFPAEQYSTPLLFSCHEQDINLYAKPVGNQGGVSYFVDDYPNYAVTVNSSGFSYHFHLKSGHNSENWISGAPVNSTPVFSGFRLSFSTGKDGAWGGYEDAEDDGTEISVRRVISPAEWNPWYLTVEDKDSNHPYDGQGSSSGFTISGLQSPELTLRKGDTYLFNQTGEANEDHPLYISTDPAGANTNIFSSGTALTDVFPEGIPGYGIGEGTLVFKVPYDAPDTLYYQCKNHQYMGGKLILKDAIPASGTKPGETVIATFNQQTDGHMYYYAADCDTCEENAALENMGGLVLLKKHCAGGPVEF